MPKNNKAKVKELKTLIERSEVAHRERILKIYKRINALEFEDQCKRTRRRK
jgi:hypothetical protein